MRKTITLILLFLFLLLGGCSSPSLLEAIGKTGYENVKILMQDDSEQIVLFLSEDYTGEPMLVLNTFSKKKGRYKYSVNGEFGQRLDLTSSYEIINVTTVGNRSKRALWGFIYDYPKAKTLSYSLENQNGDVIFASNVKIDKTNFIFDILPHNIDGKYNKIHYALIDTEDSVIVKKKGWLY